MLYKKKLFENNNIVVGLLCGVVSTLIGSIVMYVLFEFVINPIANRELISTRVMALTGLSANVPIVNAFMNRGSMRSARGVMVAFMLGAAYIIYKFFSQTL
ncbi:MAG: hypothetical protein SGJ04_03675 [Bacteroidota bacterium]|nr:hypothetical protein [Bacteroidota bacterium]